MLTVVANNQDSRVISIPADELEKIGISEGEEVEFSKENDEIILRSTKEIERKRAFEGAKTTVLEEWNEVFVELAKGVDDNKKSEIKPEGKFLLTGTENGSYKFILQNVAGKIIFESPSYDSRNLALEAIDSLKKLYSAIQGENLEFPVADKLETT